VNIPFVLALGANIGDRMSSLSAAVAALQAEGIVLEAASPVYETPPWGYTQQPDFLNAVVVGHTQMPALVLLNTLQSIERGLGRTATFRNGPRAIDLDLLVHGSLVMQTERLTLPHPRLHERAFVLLPWADIQPHYVVPQLEATVAQLLAQLPAADLQAVHRWPAPLPIAAALKSIAS